MSNKGKVYKKYSIEEIRSFVESKGGTLLTDKYTGTKQYLHLQCSKGHQWKSKWCYVNTQGNWCSICSGKKIDNPILKIQKHAKSKGGILVSDTYRSNRTKMSFVCANQHEFEASWFSVGTMNSWCPYCSIWKTEEYCRKVFEEIFSVRFEKTRSLDFLSITNKNGKNTRIELDGYSKELSIAFEYNGEQHYKQIGRFSTPLYDDLKISLCEENNVKLFVIPYTAISSLKKEIKKQAADLGIDLPSNFKN